MEADKKKFTFDFSYNSMVEPSHRRYNHPCSLSFIVFQAPLLPHADPMLSRGWCSPICSGYDARTLCAGGVPWAVYTSPRVLTPPILGPASSYTTQTHVYNDLGTDVVKACFEGFNGCVFAYGQTGSGKSYSMMGYGEKGLIPRICEGIFTRSAKMKKEVRFLAPDPSLLAGGVGFDGGA